MRTSIIIVIAVAIVLLVYWMQRDRIRRKRMITVITERLGSIARIEEKTDEELKEILKSIS